MRNRDSVSEIAIVGCGAIGARRAAALRPSDRVVSVYDPNHEAALRLSHSLSPRPKVALSLDELLEERPDAVIVATTHNALAESSMQANLSGAHVLIEKPGGLNRTEVAQLVDAARDSGLKMKIGFNHRFHPGIAEAVSRAKSGRYGEIFYMRGVYGHGGRLGYETEWRANKDLSGGGELIDQGMHLIDISHWLLGALPLNSALLRTHFWRSEVEDTANLTLGEPYSRTDPWASLSVSWAEWKNRFLLEIYCRTAKLEVVGLTRSYGSQVLRIYEMSEAMGPPTETVFEYPAVDPSWEAEWLEFVTAIEEDRDPLGNIEDALYAWGIVEDAYELSDS